MINKFLASFVLIVQWSYLINISTAHCQSISVFSEKKIKPPSKQIISLNIGAVWGEPLYTLNYDKVIYTKGAWQLGYQLGLGWGRYTGYNSQLRAGAAGNYKHDAVVIPTSFIVSWGKRASKLDILASYIFFYTNPSIGPSAVRIETYELYSNSLQIGLGWRYQRPRGGFFFQIHFKAAFISLEHGYNRWKGKAEWRFGSFFNPGSLTVNSHFQFGVGWAFPVIKKNKSPKE